MKNRLQIIISLLCLSFLLTTVFLFKEIKYYSNILLFINNELVGFINKTDDFKLVNNDQIISHGGGIIDGFVYTNSLEALDFNYSQGSRMFELDIRKTKDNHFVAVHDWNEWKQMTEFQGNTKPNLEEFKRKKIYQKFTPLDIDRINLWFEKHHDAILVTDKFNDPSSFILEYKFKDRLIMELFSIESIKKAKDNGIDFLASWSIFENMDEQETINLILKLKIKYLTVPNGIVYKNPTFLHKLSLITKIYSFGSYKGIEGKKFGKKTETYVLCKESKYFYGVYSDIYFNNLNIINCNEF